MIEASAVVSSSTSQLSVEQEKRSSDSGVGGDLHPVAHEVKLEGTSAEDAGDVENLPKIATSDYSHYFTLTFIIVALLLSIFLVAPDMTIVATAIPRITD